MLFHFFKWIVEQAARAVNEHERNNPERNQGWPINRRWARSIGPYRGSEYGINLNNQPRWINHFLGLARLFWGVSPFLLEGCPFLAYVGDFCFIGGDAAVAGGCVGVGDCGELGFGEWCFFV